MDPYALIASSAAVGLAVAAPFGPMSLLCVRQTLAAGWAGGLSVGAGIAAADGTFAALAVAGMGAVAQFTAGYGTLVQLAGAAVLAGLGLRSLVRTAPDALPAAASPRHSRAFTLGYALTLTNLPTIGFFAAIAGTLGGTASVRHGAVFSTGVALGSLAWWLCLVTVVHRLRARLGPAAIAAINRVAGVVLIGLGLAAAWHALAPAA